MADSKISNLTAATTPLAGTEVLPIVQSGTTKKVATDDLTVKNLRSNATTGILQVAGPAAASTRVMTVPDANFTAARTDAAQSFTGDQTLSTGNLVIGTSGKGIDFSATSDASGMTSELLADYEEGTFTPTVAGVALTIAAGRYTKIGRTVFVEIFCRFPATADTTTTRIANLPFTPVTSGNTYLGAVTVIGSISTHVRNLTTVSSILPRTATDTSFTNVSFSSAEVIVGGVYTTS